MLEQPNVARAAVEEALRVSLYVTYSHPTQIARSDILRPVHAGRSSASIDLALPGDNSGANISGKNGSYCELTTHFWAWKNDDASDIFGLFHYRRFLDLSGIDRRTTAAGTIPVGAVSETFVDKFGLTHERSRLLDGQFDVISPRPVDVRIHGADSVLGQYEQSPDHFVADLLKARDVMRELYPSDLVHFDEVMAGRSLIQHNVYVMKRDIFEAYSQWLFAILGELERRTDISCYSSAGCRVYGYVAERLFTVFVRRIQMEGKKVLFANLVFVDGLSPWQRFKSKAFVAWQHVAAKVGKRK